MVVRPSPGAAMLALAALLACLSHARAQPLPAHPHPPPLQPPLRPMATYDEFLSHFPERGASDVRAAPTPAPAAERVAMKRR